MTPTRLEVASVSKRAGRRTILREVSLAVDAPRVVGLVGPNGAGKTTLTRILVGLIRPDRGTVTYGGSAMPAALVDRRVVYSAGGGALPPSVRVRQWAELFGVSGGDVGTRHRLGTLSHGQRQLVALRVALAVREPDLVVLDEPWEGLDVVSGEWLAARLRRCRDGGAIVVVSSHRLDQLTDLCDEYALLRDGTIRRLARRDDIRRALVATTRSTYV